MLRFSDVFTRQRLRASIQCRYTLDQWGQDTGGVGHLPGTNYNNYAWQQKGKPCSSQHCGNVDYTQPFEPTALMCTIWDAWGHFIAAASRMDSELEPWTYDLINCGREVLAQMALPGEWLAKLLFRNSWWLGNNVHTD